jgi:hypothetical protein
MYQAGILASSIIWPDGLDVIQMVTEPYNAQAFICTQTVIHTTYVTYYSANGNLMNA